uniref:DNA/RNA-binding protein Alba-like domain-containing protein n=1 Tax=Arcella intermedia TaxID=1963864 RepID=A0A6B2LQU8_9EUKA
MGQAKTSDTVKVSSSKSLFYYVDLAVKFLKEQPQVTLSALGYAITTAVTIAEILKGQNIVVVKSIRSSMTSAPERRPNKPKIEIVIVKSEKFDELYEKKQLLTQEKQQIRDALNATRKRVQDKIST